MLGPKFLQLYLTTSVEILEKIVPEAAQNGYLAIVVTCDHATYRVRDNTLPLFEEASKNIDPELQNSISLPNMDISDIMVQKKFTVGSITWANIEWIKNLTTLPIICKGILSPIDAELAIKYGADGIIVRFVFVFIQLTEFTYFSILSLLVITVVDRSIQHHLLLNV
jgi:isopentenyl diphosphate isomerase/L-lactate dehydrogenase-like FMN-dependent dehydrogenase